MIERNEIMNLEEIDVFLYQTLMNFINLKTLTKVNSLMFGNKRMVAQLAEAMVLETIKCEFESHSSDIVSGENINTQTDSLCP